MFDSLLRSDAKLKKRLREPTEEELDKDLSNQVNKEVTKAKCATVPLTQDDVDNFYLGFSNKTLWPLFHYFMEYTEFDNDQWEAYKTVNQKFADVILENIEHILLQLYK